MKRGFRLPWPIRRRERTGIHLYTMGWNEERMLGFFFRHYDEIVDRYVIYDDGSTDRTLAILAAHPRVEIRRFERVVKNSFVMSAQRLHNAMWKESRSSADWVIVTAIDEHLYRPGLLDYLAGCRAVGITAVPALGYQMLASDFPHPSERLSQSRTRGAPYRMMNKLSVFAPAQIEETNFGRGRHRAAPCGNVVYPPTDQLLLLHYKYIGMSYASAREASLGARLGPRDVGRFGGRYFWDEERLRAEIYGFAAQALDLTDPSFHPHRQHPSARWWREPSPASMPETIPAQEARVPPGPVRL